MKKYFFCGLACLLLAACNKNQALVEQLDGRWQVVEETSYINNTLDTTIRPQNGLIYEFDACRLIQNEQCTGREIQQTSAGEIVTEFKFSVIEAGSQISFDYDESLLVDNFSGYVTDYDEQNLVLEFYFGNTPPITYFIYQLERR